MAKTNIEFLNDIRAISSPTYQDRIPEATRNNIAEIANALDSYKPLANEFLDGLFNKIGMQLIASLSFEDPLKFMNKEKLTLGQDVEDMWVVEAQAMDYNPKGDKLFEITKPVVRAIYHRLDRRLMYKVTIYPKQLRNAFISEYGISKMYSTFMNTLTTADKLDTFIMKKQALSDYQIVKQGYYNITTPEVTNQTSADEFMIILRQTILRMSLPTKDYNKAKELQQSKKNQLKLLINMSELPKLDVYSLSKAFQKEFVEYQVEIIPLDNFGDLPNTQAILIDTRLPQVRDDILEMTNFFNPEGLYWQNYFHHWQLMSMSIWYNAVRLTTNDTENGVDKGSVVTEIKKGKDKGDFLLEYFNVQDGKQSKDPILTKKLSETLKPIVSSNMSETETNRVMEGLLNGK